MRRCEDCGSDISNRGASAYLCLACLRLRHLEHDRRWHREHPECGRASDKRQRLKTKRTCRACGKLRRKWKTYCDLCGQAFREISLTLAKRRYRGRSNRSIKILMPRRGEGVSHLVVVKTKTQRLTLKDLPTRTHIVWWSALAAQYPNVNLHAELLKAMDWHGADRVKSPKLYFRNWVERASLSAPSRDLTADEVRARLRIVS